MFCFHCTPVANKAKTFNRKKQEFGSRWMSVELICYVKTIFLYKFYDFFCCRYSLMNRSCYNNLFQFMQHDDFRNLNWVIFNDFWNCFLQSNDIPFTIRWNRLPFQETRALLKYCNWLVYVWRYQSLVIWF